MDRIGSRRHRLNRDEAPHVYALVLERLHALLMDHKQEQNAEKLGIDRTTITKNLPEIVKNSIDGKMQPDNLQLYNGPLDDNDEEGFLYGEAGALFRLLIRMDTNKVGKPSYPPLTWDTLEAYLGNGPYEKDTRPLGPASEVAKP